MDADADSQAVALREFTRLSVGSAVWLGLIGVCGVVYATTLGTSQQEQVRFVGLGVGAVLVLTALGFLAALFVAWRRDVRAASLVARDRPEYASGGAATFHEASFSCWSVLIAVAFTGFGINRVMSAADGAAWGWLTLVLMGAVAFSLVMGVRWRGSEYVGVHAEGIRMLRRGKLESAPWHRVLYFESALVGIEGKPDRASVSGEVETRIKQSSIAAGLATFDARLRGGESIDLGGVTLQPSLLVVEGAPIRWDEIASVTYEHDPENCWTHVVVRSRGCKRRGKVMETGIANFPVFEGALRMYTGLRVVRGGGAG